MSPFYKDWFWRILATGVAVGLAVILPAATSLSVWWAVPIATGLTAVHAAFVQVGNGDSSFSINFLERTGWTAAEAALAVVSIDAIHLPVGWITLAAAILASLKGLVAQQVGNSQTAAMIPGRLL